MPSYVMSGTQTITVERLDDDLTLRAVEPFGVRGRVVTFTPVPQDTLGSGMPWHWIWTPDATGVPDSLKCTYGANPCTAVINESGTMQVEYKFDNIGTLRKAQAHVEASLPPIQWLVAIPHVHPSDTSEVVPPGMCPFAPRGGFTAPGTSPADDATAYDAGVPVYAVDKRNVYRTVGFSDADHKLWPRHSTCSVL